MQKTTHQTPYTEVALNTDTYREEINADTTKASTGIETLFMDFTEKSYAHLSSTNVTPYPSVFRIAGSIWVTFSLNNMVFPKLSCTMQLTLSSL